MAGPHRARIRVARIALGVRIRRARGLLPVAACIPWPRAGKDHLVKAVFKRAVPYAKDALDLPVKDVESAIPYYERVFGFKVVSRTASPHAGVILARDVVQIGLSENGGDPTQEGCFFEVDDVEAAQSEIKDASGSPC